MSITELIIVGSKNLVSRNRILSTHDSTSFFLYPIPHCSYLDIYISQNIRLCKGDFEGKFETILQAKGISFFIWKFTFIILIFLLVFAEFVKSTAFYTLLLLFQRVDISKLWFLHQNAIQTCQLFRITATVFKKQWIWQILQKIEGKWE